MTIKKLGSAGLVAASILIAYPAAAQNTTAIQADTFRQRIQGPALAPTRIALQAPPRQQFPALQARGEGLTEINSVLVSGSSAFSRQDLQAMFDPVKGKKGRLSDLESIVRRIEARYRDADHLLATAFIPPQSVINGVYHVQVEEGRINEVIIDGGSDADRAYIKNALDGLARRGGVTYTAIASALARSAQLPGLSISATFRPTATPGQMDLMVSVRPAAAQSSLSLGHASSATAGRNTLEGRTLINKPLGLDGRVEISASASTTDGQSQTLSLRYDRALGRAGTTLSLGALAGRTVPARAGAAQTSENTVTSIGPRLRQVLLKNSYAVLQMDVALSVNRARSRDADTVTAEDRTSVGEASVAMQLESPSSQLQTTLSLFRGLGIAGAMDSKTPRPSVTGFEPRFTKWVYDTNTTWKLPANTSVHLEMQTQYSSDVLLLGDAVAYGGNRIGRGYVSSAITGDRGAGGVLEFRHDSTLNLGNKVISLQPYVFVDRALTLDNTTRHKQNLRSSGVGLRLKDEGKASIDVMLARSHIVVPVVEPETGSRVVVNSEFKF